MVWVRGKVSRGKSHTPVSVSSVAICRTRDGKQTDTQTTPRGTCVAIGRIIYNATGRIARRLVTKLCSENIH